MNRNDNNTHSENSYKGPNRGGYIGSALLVYLVCLIIYAILSYVFVPNSFFRSNNGEDEQYNASAGENMSQKDSALVVDVIQDEDESAIIQEGTPGKEIVYGKDTGNLEEGKWFYYDQLDEHDKAVYETIIDLLDHREDDQYFVNIIADGEYDDNIVQNIFSNVRMITYDHPEKYYLKLCIPVVIYPYQEQTQTIYCVRNYEMDSDELQKMKELEDSAESFLSDIDMNQSQDKIELQIHDKLIKTVSYDTSVYESDMLNSNRDDFVVDLAHTAYGVLVADSSGNANSAVCDGYSLAFEYLLNKADIYSTVVIGYGKEGPGPAEELSENAHAWNMVCLDGDWYEVDCTWDDMDLEIKYPNEYINIEEFGKPIELAKHHYFNITSETMTATPSNPECVVLINGYLYNFADVTSHARGSLDKSCEALIDMLPVAEGTKYAFSAD